MTVLEEGGHIAEIFDKATRRQPALDAAVAVDRAVGLRREHAPAYGDGVDAALLAGIMGHNLCLDIFGGPSEEEAAAGLPVHGEASIAARTSSSAAATDRLVQRARLPLADLRVERRIALARPNSARPRDGREPVGRRSARWAGPST